jgi:hypothetical protein
VNGWRKARNYEEPMDDDGWSKARNYEKKRTPDAVVLRTFPDGRRVILAREASRMKDGCTCYKLLVGEQLYFAAEFVDATLDRELQGELLRFFTRWTLALPEA